MAQRGGGLPGFQDLEVMRAEAGLSVVRFCELLGELVPVAGRGRC